MKALALALLMFLHPMGQNPAVRAGNGAISGELRNLDGAPAAGVRVGAIGADSVSTTAVPMALIGITETNSAGQFRIENLPPGSYYVAAGFLDTPTFFPGVKTVAEARAVAVGNGGTVGSIDFSLVRSAGVRVTGRVSSLPSGMPAGMARVVLQPVGGSPLAPGALPTETAIRSDGTFEFQRIAPGSYVPRVTILGRAFPAAAVAIVVGDSDVTGVDVAAPPVLIGRVEVEGGSLLPLSTNVSAALGTSPDVPSLAQIQLRNTESGVSQNSQVRADGLFAFPADRGSYRLQVGTLPVGFYIRSISYGDADLLRTPLRLDANAAGLIRVVLTTARPADAPPGVRISGRLTGLPAGKPTSTQAMTFTMAASTGDITDVTAVRRVGEATIHEDGGFELLRVPPGSWSINLLDLEARVGGIVQTITVGDRDVTGLEIAVRTTAPPNDRRALADAGQASVSGKVIVPSSNTRLPDTVALSLGPAGTRTASVQTDGSFVFSGVPQGNWTIRVSPLFSGAGPITASVVVSDKDVTDVQIRLPEMYEVRGRYLFEGAAALPPELSRLQLSAQTGSASRNSLPQGDIIAMQLAPGQYEISVLNLPKTYMVEAINYGDVDLRGTPLKLDGPLKSEIVVRLSSFPPRGPLVKVSGRVTNLPAAPYIPNPKIILTRDTKAGGGAAEAPVDKDGGFEFKGLPAGPYALTTYGLTSDFTSKVEIKDAEINALTVTLGGLAVPYVPGSSFAGTFTSNDQITLRGVISQGVTNIRPNAPVGYLRMEVPNAAGEPKSWAVVLNLPRSPAADPSDIAKLKVGTRVVAVGNPANDGSNRIYLTPLTGPSTVFGIDVVP